VTVCIWETPPPVAVTVTLYVPDVDELQDSVAVVEDGSVMLVGMIVQERPAGGESVRLIVPVKPFYPARLMMEVAEEPVLTADGEGCCHGEVGRRARSDCEGYRGSVDEQDACSGNRHSVDPHRERRRHAAYTRRLLFIHEKMASRGEIEESPVRFDEAAYHPRTSRRTQARNGRLVI